MATVIQPDGTTKQVEPKDGVSFHCPELYKMLNCHTVQVVEGQIQGEILIFDESFSCRGDIVKHSRFGMALESYDKNGKRFYKPYLNRVATEKMHERMGPYTYNVICGAALLCKNEQFQ